MNPINTDNSVPPFPAIPASLQQRDMSISATTEAIAALASQMMEKLNERATTLAHGANFDLALRDAEVMQAVHPTSSLGYLKAGDIYQKKGRQQDAAAMYEKGLANVPASDTSYTNLQAGHDDAVNAANTRVDFISQLSLDMVVTDILPLLFDNVTLSPYIPCPYFYVSRTWRERILHSTDLTFGMYESRSNQPFRTCELAKFLRRVKSLGFEIGKGSPTHDENALAFMNADFPNLRHFTIEYFESNDNDLMYILQSLGRNLTHFRLYNEGMSGSQCIHLSHILRICPNLVSVSMGTFAVDRLSIRYPKMTHFCLSICENNLPASTITNILSHLPSLVFLDISPFPQAEYLDTVNRLCPNLKVLRCDGILPFDHGDYDQHRNGLQKFSFGYDCDIEPENSEPLVRHLLANHQTLDHVVLVGGISDMSDLLDGRDMGLSLQFDRLERLEIIAANHDLLELATFIIRRSRHLHTIHVDYHERHANGLFNAIQGLNHLQTLHVENAAPAARSFGALLEHHVRLGMNSSLMELKISIGLQTSILSCGPTIADLSRLTSFVLSTSGMRPSAEYLPLLSMIGQGCRSLNYLELHCGYSQIPDGSVAQIKNHPTLQCLRLHGSSISQSDVVQVVSLPSLKHFIFNAPIKDYLLELLQHNIPKVEQRRR